MSRVVEGSIPNKNLSGEGYWAAVGTDPKTGRPIKTTEWLDRLAPKALAVIGAGTCATYGGIHAMKGNPTGCMGLQDYLGATWKSKAGLPIVNVPGCPVQPDNFMETFLYLLRMLAGLAPLIPIDHHGRPTWLFGPTVHEGCDRAAYCEQADFAEEYGSRKCLVKIGCWGPVVQCNVPKRGWISGMGGCPNVGGICIGCTMPGFRDKFMPFMDEPPGARISSQLVKPNGSGCHLDAAMVEHGLAELKPGLGAVVLIESVGNLVCPALFDLGERAKVVIFSVTEGEDKPLKFPHMFRAAGLVVLNKIDLLPHLDFALDDALQNVRRVNPGTPVLTVSARTGKGLPQWYDWLRNQAKASREFSVA